MLINSGTWWRVFHPTSAFILNLFEDFCFTFKAMICEIHSISWNVKVEMFSSHQIELGHCFSISQRTILILILILEPSRKVIKWSFHRPKLVLFSKLIAFEWWKKWHILGNIIKNWKEIKTIVACRSRNIIFLKIMQNLSAAAGAKKIASPYHPHCICKYLALP